jgi:C_GCAxxG_C_C family probable redox protein
LERILDMIDPNTLTAEQRTNLIQRAIDLAQAHFLQDGYNCAESVLRGVVTALDLPAAEAVFKAATPFGGGIGLMGSTCGALSGAILAMGLVHGRTTPDAEQKMRAYTHAENVWRAFSSQTGGEDCRSIRKYSFQDAGHRAECARFVAIGAEAAAMELLAG